ncbi:hypothetical protein GCM10010124_13100 [Pilimelia terevasa]|uniref:IrrE N-terminal-like domain-containing protein n=1 Tax=Pilimelia terevasa TaxID=53372 RepID=A0A8J3BHI0_9ACTN|nr:toxin [Pilimelia terevasa]GGK21989.1 hypothetical protein GCM10010124_13100 [Pilimelia terevasa]
MWSSAAAGDRSPDSFRRLRRRCAARLRALPLHGLDSTEALCRRLSVQRGRPIVLSPMPSDGAVCGLWLALDTTDLVFYDQASTGAHRAHIIAHELSHIICGHRSAEPLDAGTAAHLFPDLDPALVRGMLRRAAYSTVQEREAEITASLLLHLLHAAPAPADGSAADPTAARIAATLTDPPRRRWSPC